MTVTPTDQVMLSLHDRDDLLKNLNVKQEISEMQHSGYR